VSSIDAIIDFLESNKTGRLKSHHVALADYDTKDYVRTS